MKNSKIELIFSKFFFFILIFASISQKYLKKWAKIVLLRLSWKLPHNLIWSTQNSNTFFPTFSIFIFIFALISQICLNKCVKLFFNRFSWKLSFNLILISAIQKSNSFSYIFLSWFSLLLWLVKNVLKNRSKFCLLRFSWKLSYNLIFIWGTQKSSSFFQIFFILIFIFRINFFPIFIRQIVKVKKWNSSRTFSFHFFSDFYENVHIT